MAASTMYVKIACLNLAEDDRRPMVSAVNSTSRALGLEFEWTQPAFADLCIVDVSRTDPAALPQFCIRYASRRNGQAVDVTRPIRVRDLMTALNLGARQVEERRAAAKATTARRYRGAIVEEPPRSEGGQEQAPAPGADDRRKRRKLMYRGRPVE